MNIQTYFHIKQPLFSTFIATHLLFFSSSCFFYLLFSLFFSSFWHSFFLFLWLVVVIVLHILQVFNKPQCFHYSSRNMKWSGKKKKKKHRFEDEWSFKLLNSIEMTAWTEDVIFLSSSFRMWMCMSIQPPCGLFSYDFRWHYWLDLTWLVSCHFY